MFLLKDNIQYDDDPHYVVFGTEELFFKSQQTLPIALVDCVKSNMQMFICK